MMEKDQEVTEMKEFVIEKTEKMEQVLKTIAKLLAANTNYATIVSAPQAQRGKVKFIQLSKRGAREGAGDDHAGRQYRQE